MIFPGFPGVPLFFRFPGFQVEWKPRAKVDVNRKAKATYEQAFS